MKRFAFQLARVMDWRRAQAHVEDGKLERLHAELRGIEARLAGVRSAREQSERALLTAGSATGMELAALDTFKKTSAVECAKLAESAARVRKAIDTQLPIVIQKRREVRLLEKCVLPARLRRAV